MTFKSFGISLGIGIGLVVLLWLPVFWSYIFAKWKRLAYPKRFAFFSGCTSYGIQTLIGALLLCPFAALAVMDAPLYCEDYPEAWVCYGLGFIEDWSSVLSLISAVVVTALTPAVFNRYVWSSGNGR
ncbi:hypothetical protein GCM10011352_16970 [Marinobacterium zhoushanense]|uniref:Uncharacterized protein n=1 Tax=Marinobacterium zhoushanense TaxID=1679163 RepID=A0ABQ1K862_9GAMM|nr:hypothetical protein [Marinobacterium zhoushanense]GGB91528.1 hypothetical protein GCM10011352_16970 [Marinobacterium zhoushanense]